MSLTIYPGKTHNHHLPTSGGTQVSCRGCREWFDGKLGACPDCGWERPAWNKWLRTAKLNNQLYSQMESDNKAVSFVKQARNERPPS